MRCFYPITGYQHRNLGGAVGFKDGDLMKTVKLRCGNCIGCRITKTKEWQSRCVHEAAQHEISSFITLTYREEFYRPSLEYGDFQKFIRRLRKERGSKTTRFFMSGEYGEEGDRPHFHALLFGIGFTDRTIWKTTRAGYRLYRSAELEKLWPVGHSSIGEVTPASAAYCAGYAIKKVGGDLADTHYLRVDKRTGEEVLVEPEFARMSLKPGIGQGFLEKYGSDIYRDDAVVIEGRQQPPPRYYDKRLKKTNEDRFDEVSFDRFKKNQMFNDKDWNRLATIEEVTKAKYKQRKGEL